MKIENLRKGMVIKNYKVLASILDVDVVTGNQKRAQIKEFSRYFKYHKNGHKFIIDEIYDKPKEKKIKNNGKYGETIQYAILKYLLRNCNNNDDSIYDYYEVCNSINTYLLNIGMININYITLGRDYNYKLVSKKFNIDISILNDFKNNTRAHLTNAFTTALKNLQSDGILKFSSEIMVKINNEIRIATFDEEAMINKIEQKVLKSMDIHDKSYIFNNNLKVEFYKKVISLLITDEKYQEIEYYFNAYKIVFKKENLQLGLKNIKIDRQSSRDLNKLTRTHVLEGILKRNANSVKVKNNVGFGELPEGIDKIRSNSNYLKFNKKLLSIVLNKTTKIDLDKEISHVDSSKAS